MDKLKSKQKKIKSKQKKINGKFYGSFLHKVLTLHPLRLRISQLSQATYSNQPNPSISAIKELGATCNLYTSCIPYVVYIPNSNYWRPNEAGNKYKLLLEKYSKDLSIKFLDSSSIINPNNK